MKKKMMILLCAVVFGLKIGNTYSNSGAGENMPSSLEKVALQCEEYSDQFKQYYGKWKQRAQQTKLYQKYTEMFIADPATGLLHAGATVASIGLGGYGFLYAVRQSGKALLYAGRACGGVGLFGLSLVGLTFIAQTVQKNEIR